jgi:hypothetical protein
MAVMSGGSALPVADTRRLCGWRVSSAVPLPELLPWTGAERSPDLTIGLAPVPPRLEAVVAEHPLLQVAADGCCRFEMPGVAVYLVDAAGRRVTIDPVLPPAAPDIRAFLLSTVFAILCHRRGLLALHGACVEIGGRAVVLAGPSGIGKSMLAGHLMGCGHALLADDVTVVDTAAPGGPVVLPTVPQLTLGTDALQQLAASAASTEPVRPGLDRRRLPVADRFRAEPLPLSAVVHLDVARGHAGDPMRRLNGAEAVAWLGRDLYRAALARRLKATGHLLPAMIAVAGAPLGSRVLLHGHEPGGLRRSVDIIRERLQP